MKREGCGGKGLGKGADGGNISGERKDLGAKAKKRATKKKNRGLGGPRFLENLETRRKSYFGLHRPGGMSPTCA
jgi:hypothetical protein